jgi:large subunit ribosomal protein L9
MAIEVMLMDNVKKLGKSGEIVKVAPGYARNYLFTKGLAALATEAAKRKLKKLEAERAAKAAELKKEALEVARQLDKLELNVSAPTTDGTKLYGAISVTDILAAIEANRGVKLERSQISLEDELRVVGEHVATIDLGYGVTVKFKITIADDKSAEEA